MSTSLVQVAEGQTELLQTCGHWISEHQTIFVFGLVAGFWFVRFMAGHKLVALRCWSGLHKYEPFDTEQLDEAAKNAKAGPCEDPFTIYYDLPAVCRDCGHFSAIAVAMRGLIYTDADGRRVVSWTKTGIKPQ